MQKPSWMTKKFLGAVALVVLIVVGALGYIYIRRERTANPQQVGGSQYGNSAGQAGGQSNGNYGYAPPQSSNDGVRTPQLFISGGQQGYSSGGLVALSSAQAPEVQLASYNLSGEAKIDVYEADDSALLNYLVHDKDGNQINKTTDVSQFRFVKSFTTQLAQNSSTPPKVLLPIGDSGIWYLRITVGNASDRAFVIRSKTGGLVKQAENDYVFWAQDFKTKRSQVQGTIHVFNLQDGVHELGTAALGDDGLAKFGYTQDADLAMIQSDTDRAIIPINLRSLNSSYNYKPFQPAQLNSKFFLFTDRPIYKPGDSIYFKSIVRDDNDAHYTIPTGSVEVLIFKDYDERSAIFKKSYPVSKDGTISGQFVLPSDAATGDYQIKIHQPGIDDQYDWINSSYSTFLVDYFRKPEYTLDIKVPQTEMVTGEKMPVTISGSYFFGQPLANQKVKYSVYSSDFYEYQYEADLANGVSDNYRYGFWDNSKVSEQEVTLDDKGEATFDLDTSTVAEGGKSKVFSVEAEVIDQSQNPAFERKNIVVYPGEFSIFQKDYNNFVRVGDKADLSVTLKQHRTAKLAGVQLTAKIHRENWVPYQNPGDKYPQYRQESEDLPQLKATTDSNGNATFNFTPKSPGSYTWTVEAKDQKGNTISKDFYTWISNGSDPFYFSADNNNLTIKTDKDKYNPGDTAKVYISSVVPNRDVFLSFERDHVNRYQVVKLSGKQAKIDAPVSSDDIPNIIVAGSSFSDSQIDRGSTGMEVSTDSKKLVVSVTPDRSTYGPGDTVKLNVESKDVQGNPVSTDVAVWSVDKALFELVDNQPQSIFDTFWSDRYDATAENNSLDGILTQGGAERGGCFTGDTLISMADGSSKPISEIKVGDSVKTRDQNGGAVISEKVTALHNAEVGGYLIINGNLKVTTNHLLNVDGLWKEAGSVQLGDTLRNASGAKVPVVSLEYQGGKTTVYNFTVDKTHTYFANGVWVHNQKGDGGARTVFKDTAYWNPNIKTDSNGRAQVSFKLPDNLTTWVIAGVAATTNTMVGQTTTEIVVTKDVVVRPIVPNILRVGDDLILSAVVQNFTDQDRDFNVDLKYDSGDISALGQNPVHIPSKGLVQVDWKVHPNKEVDSSKLTFSAVATDDAKVNDTVVQAMPVRTVGFWDTQVQTANDSKTFTLQLAPDAKSDKTTVTLDLSPTLLGTLPTAMKYLVDYPYGCVEQTTSHFVPALIAKENPDLFPGVLDGKNIDAIVKQGITLLRDLQQDQGGWHWWHEGQSDPFITSYVVEYLLKAKQLGYTVDQQILDKAEGYLEQDSARISNPNDNLSLQTSNKIDFVARIYALSMLGSEKGKTALSDYSDLTPDVIAMAVLTNNRNGYSDLAGQGLQKLRDSAKHQGNSAFWDAGRGVYFGSQDASTAWAIRALLTSGKDQELVAQAARFLVNHRTNDYWSNTFATSQVIRAVTDMSKQNKEADPNYTYSVTLDGKQIKSGSIKKITDSVSLSIPTKDIKAGGSKIVISKNGDGQIYSTLLAKQFRTDTSAALISHGLTVKREYENTKGKGVPIGIGDLVNVTISVSGLKESQNYGVIEDQLPSGLIPVNRSLKNQQYQEGDANYGYPYSGYGYYWDGGQDTTENGMILSMYSWGTDTQNFTYQARAVSEGTFVVPPARAELMYEPDVYGRSGIETVKIVKTSASQADQAISAVANKLGVSISLLKVILAIVIMLLLVGVAALAIYRKSHAKPNLPPAPQRFEEEPKDGPPTP